jgi:WD40 repeat protein
MAHFLSDVTMGKLDARREEVARTNAKGIKCVDDVLGAVRCVASCFRQVDGTHTEEVLWTGDQEGGITVRVWSDFSPMFEIDRKPNAFVFSLLNVGPFMWAGLSDGNIRFFDCTSCEMVCEAKGHSSAVTQMIFACGYVFSSSQDWGIVQWDPVQFTNIKRYNGHQNAVRCLASDHRSLLFSGGDDYVVRCWDLENQVEVRHPWPLIGHVNAVVDMVLLDVHLFTSYSSSSKHRMLYNGVPSTRNGGVRSSVASSERG